MQIFPKTVHVDMNGGHYLCLFAGEEATFSFKSGALATISLRKSTLGLLSTNVFLYNHAASHNDDNPVRLNAICIRAAGKPLP